MGCFACKTKAEFLRLQKKMERMECGEEISRLEEALRKEKEARLNAVNLADRKASKIEEIKEKLQRAREREDHLRDRIVWIEEERDEAREELSDLKRSSKKTIDDLEKQLSTARWKIEKVASEKDREKAKEIRTLKEEYERRLKQKEAENAALREQLERGGVLGSGAKGKAKAATSRNSSTPPGQDPTHPKIPNNRIPSEKHQGGQPGHPFHPRTKYTVKEPVILPDPPEVLEHPDEYYLVDEIKKQKVSVHLVVEVKEYIAKVYRNHKTRKTIHAEFPEDVGHLEVNYDASVEALATYLHTVANVPYNKIQEILREATDGMLTISVGTLAQMEKRFSELTEEDRQKIAAELLAGKYMNIDGTMFRSEGKQKQILIMRNKEAVLYKMSGCKGDKAVEGTPAEHYRGTMVCDSEATFMKLGARRQGCLIHELRYLIRARENVPELTWHHDMYKHVNYVIDRRNEDVDNGETKMSPKERKEIEKKWDEIIARGVEEIEKLLPGTFTCSTGEQEFGEKENQAKNEKKARRKGEDRYTLPSGIDLTKDINLLKRLSDRKYEYLLFLTDYSIPHHNNDAEKSARTVKIHMKPNGGMRSDKYAGYYTDSASVLETEQLKGRSRYQKLRDVFSRKSSETKGRMQESLEAFRRKKLEKEITVASGI